MQTPNTTDTCSTHATAAVKVRLRGVCKRFGNTLAADQVDLDIHDGEFLTLLGASGCGKTTLMRMIAGFERPDAGTIHIDGQDVTNLAPHMRHLGMVFQQYSLFPHMTVAQNIAYGLQAQKRPAAEIAARVDTMLNLVELPEAHAKRPSQLSGGQQQRIALARALATRPSVLMLDEPLAALDLKLRRQLQHELKRIHQHSGTTFLFVTHDQEEALSMSDRVAVIRDGRIEQIDRPQRLYCHPKNEFVADFIGDVRFLQAHYNADQGTIVLTNGVQLRLPLNCATGAVRLAVRPEQVQFTTDTNALTATVVDIKPETGSVLVQLKLSDGQTLLSRLLGLSTALTPGQSVQAHLTPDVVVFGA